MTKASSEDFITHKVFVKSCCKSRLPHKSIILLLMIVIIKVKGLGFRPGDEGVVRGLVEHRLKVGGIWGLRLGGVGFLYSIRQRPKSSRS